MSIRTYPVEQQTSLEGSTKSKELLSIAGLVDQQNCANHSSETTHCGLPCSTRLEQPDLMQLIRFYHSYSFETIEPDCIVGFRCHISYC
jgi:hypothetical protein